MLTPETIKTMTYNQAKHTLQLAYKALGLLNKLTRSNTVTKLKSRLFGNINRLKAIVKNAPKLFNVYDSFGMLRAKQISEQAASDLACVNDMFGCGWVVKQC